MMQYNLPKVNIKQMQSSEGEPQVPTQQQGESILSDKVTENELISHITTVVYTDLELLTGALKLSEEESMQLQQRRNVLTMLNSRSEYYTKNMCHFIFLRLDSQQSQLDSESLLSLQKSVCLADHIVSLNLANSLESVIEKNFLLMLQYSYRFHNTKRLSLAFVKADHKKKSVSKQGIKYYQQFVPEVLLLEEPPHKRQSPYIIQAKDIQEIYRIAKVDSKHIAKLKFTLEKYNRLQEIKERSIVANNMLFFDSEKEKKIVQREINRMKLPKKIYQHLMWKSNQVHVYRSIIQEADQNSEGEFASMKFTDAKYQIINSGLQLYGKKWMGNTLLGLKDLFDRIANRRDHKAIAEFHRACDNVSKSLDDFQVRAQDQSKKAKLRSYSKELKQFVKYHQIIIDGVFLSPFQYYKQEAKFLWRHDRRVYQRAGVFVLIVILALLQDDIILGLTMFSLGVIFLAIRI